MDPASILVGFYSGVIVTLILSLLLANYIDNYKRRRHQPPYDRER